LIILSLNSDEERDLKALLDVDMLIHHPARMAILMFLLPRGRATFTVIQRALGITSGNLSSHVKKLRNEGLVKVKKTFIELKPTTEIFLSELGRKALISYASQFSLLLQHMLEETNH
jgi:DNA-binding MarR family transcriptional regulator